MERNLDVATRVIHAGQVKPGQGAPFLAGPVFASTYTLMGEAEGAPMQYGRYQNPTWTQWEAALAELEGGPVIAFASGMAAITAVFGTVLRPGDTLLLSADGYYTVRTIAREWLADNGVSVRLVPTREMPAQRLDGVKLVWVETPSNPGLDVCDIAALARAAHAAGALLAVDNTTPTILGQAPLALGADFSVAADTKAMSGHSDVLLGHVAARDGGWVDRIVTWRKRTGAIPGPMEVWLAHRSLATLQLRLERMSTNAQQIAEFLAARRGVTGVRYPGLPHDPSHGVASRQMRYFGPIVSFELPGRAAAEAFLGACRLVIEATSFGGVHTTAERRARWGGDAVPEGFVRLSAGCEHANDLIADVDQALSRAGV